MRESHTLALAMIRSLSELANLRAATFTESLDLKISRSEKVSKLLSLLKESNTYEALVLNGSRPSLVTARDILKVVHPEKTSVASIAKSGHLRIDPDDRIYDVATTLVDNRVRLLPMIKGGELIGVINQRKILEASTGCEEMEELSAQDMMVSGPVTIEYNASVGFARALMLRGGFSHLPVISRNATLFGLITAKDLVWNFVKPRESTKVGERAGERLNWTKMSISGVADRHPLEATRRTKVSRIARDMVEKNRSCCLVIENSKPVGIITPRDIVSLLKQFKPKFQIPLYIVGMESIDEVEVNLARRKIERVAIRGLKLHPDIREIIVHGKVTPSHLGGRRRVELRARAYTNTEVFGVKADGWSSFQSVTDDLCEKLDKRLRSANTHRKKLVTRPKHVRGLR